MQLSNHTPVPAQLFLGSQPEETRKLGVLVAKATFTFGPEGGTRLDDASPVPIFLCDQRTDLGHLPKDDGIRTDDVFEVIVLGCAHAPRRRPVSRMTVAVSIGPERREMLVWGRRQWLREGDAWRASNPEPFERLPLVWEHAFGGYTDVEIDRDAWIEIADPRNRSGLGFNPSKNAESLAKDLGCPAGFPRFTWDPRLPHLEDPATPIRSPADWPEPMCWATVPLDSGVHARRVTEGEPRLGDPSPSRFGRGAFHRAHPTWVIDRPAMSAEIVLEGMRPEGTVRLALPALRVIADYRIGDRTGRRELIPHVLVLLPEEMRFYMVFRRTFSFDAVVGEARAMRLRLAQGWRRNVGEAAAR